MATLNVVMLIGNLTRDPESKQAGEHTVASFSIAVNRRSKGADGQQKDDVSYVDCEAWNKTAGLVMQYLTKGKPVLVQGSLKQERWETQDGQKRSRMKVVVNNLQFLGQRTDGQADHAASGAAAGVDESVGDPNVPF